MKDMLCRTDEPDDRMTNRVQVCTIESQYGDMDQAIEKAGDQVTSLMIWLVIILFTLVMLAVYVEGIFAGGLLLRISQTIYDFRLIPL